MDADGDDNFGFNETTSFLTDAKDFISRLVLMSNNILCQKLMIR